MEYQTRSILITAVAKKDHETSLHRELRMAKRRIKSLCEQREGNAPPKNVSTFIYTGHYGSSHFTPTDRRAQKILLF